MQQTNINAKKKLLRSQYEHIDQRAQHYTKSIQSQNLSTPKRIGYSLRILWTIIIKSLPEEMK